MKKWNIYKYIDRKSLMSRFFSHQDEDAFSFDQCAPFIELLKSNINLKNIIDSRESYQTLEDLLKLERGAISRTFLLSHNGPVHEIEINFKNVSYLVIPADAEGLSEHQREAVEDTLSNNESDSDIELMDFFTNEFGLTTNQAKFWLRKRAHYLTLNDLPKEVITKESNLVRIDRKLKKLQELVTEVQRRRTINIQAYDDELPETWENLLLSINKLEKEIKELQTLVAKENG